MSRPIALSDPFRTLAERHGGVGNLAVVLGVTSRTIHRWATGTRKLEGPARILVNRMIEEIGLKSGGIE